MRFKFTGLSDEVFPSIVTETGTLVCQPGDVVELDHDPNHPRLEPTTAKGKAIGGVIATDWLTNAGGEAGSEVVVSDTDHQEG